MQLLQNQDCPAENRQRAAQPVTGRVVKCGWFILRGPLHVPLGESQYIRGQAMQIENKFDVAASPDRVYSFLLDVNRVVTCMPGAELSDVVDPTTFKGKVRIKVGPITVSYNGTASITERDDAGRVATLQARGKEPTGSGSARATPRMSAEADGAGRSRLRLVSQLTAAGRI